MTDRWVAIQQNPTSGSGSGYEQLVELEACLKECGLCSRIFTQRDQLSKMISDARYRDSLVGIVAAGGDGTVSDVINRFPDVPVAVLPLGTENLLAKYLEIPCSGRIVARMIAEGRTRRLDLGMMGERRFFLMGTVGFDADVIHRLAALRSGTIRKWNYLKPIWQSLRKYEHPELRLYLDGAEHSVEARLAVISNLPEYAFGLPVARSARPDDGLLDLRLFQPRSAFQMLRYFYKVAFGLHEQLDDVTSAHAKTIRIESDEPVPIQADGDPAGWTPVEVTMLPEAFEVFVPPG